VRAQRPSQRASVTTFHSLLPHSPPTPADSLRSFPRQFVLPPVPLPASAPKLCYLVAPRLLFSFSALARSFFVPIHSASMVPSTFLSRDFPERWCQRPPVHRGGANLFGDAASARARLQPVVSYLFLAARWRLCAVVAAPSFCCCCPGACRDDSNLLVPQDESQTTAATPPCPTCVRTGTAYCSARLRDHALVSVYGMYFLWYSVY